jgi:hypothetical protein
MVGRETHQFGRREFLTGAVAGSFAATAMAGRTSAQTAWAGSAESRHARQRPVETASRQQSSGTPATLEGAVTTAPEPLENGVLAGTDRGLYLVREGRIETFVRTRPVRHVLAAGGDGLVVTATHGDLTKVSADGDPTWSVPSLRNAAVMTGDFLGNGTTDRLVYSQNNLGGESQHRTLVCRDGRDGSVHLSGEDGSERRYFPTELSRGEALV